MRMRSVVLACLLVLFLVGGAWGATLAEAQRRAEAQSLRSGSYRTAGWQAWYWNPLTGSVVTQHLGTKAAATNYYGAPGSYYAAPGSYYAAPGSYYAAPGKRGAQSGAKKPRAGTPVPAWYWNPLTGSVVTLLAVVMFGKWYCDERVK
jgi:hypothetical protein